MNAISISRIRERVKELRSSVSATPAWIRKLILLQTLLVNVAFVCYFFILDHRQKQLMVMIDLIETLKGSPGALKLAEDVVRAGMGSRPWEWALIALLVLFGAIGCGLTTMMPKTNSSTRPDLQQSRSDGFPSSAE